MTGLLGIPLGRLKEQGWSSENVPECFTVKESVNPEFQENREHLRRQTDRQTWEAVSISMHTSDGFQKKAYPSTVYNTTEAAPLHGTEIPDS